MSKYELFFIDAVAYTDDAWAWVEKRPTARTLELDDAKVWQDDDELHRCVLDFLVEHGFIIGSYEVDGIRLFSVDETSDTIIEVSTAGDQMPLWAFIELTEKQE